jgi:drug/metabolite transporter (DMT)-like permease
MSTIALPAAQPPRSLLPDLSLVGVTLIWGGTFLAVQTALQWSGAFAFVGMRFAVAALLALLLCRRQLAGLNRTELLGGIGIGVILYFSYNLQTLGLGHIASSTSAFLTGLYVPLVPLLQWGLFRQRPGWLAGGGGAGFRRPAALAGVDGFASSWAWANG